MKALCVGRHRYLSDHFGQFFREARSRRDERRRSRATQSMPRGRMAPDVVFCEYDLLATVPLEPWERDPFLSRVPVIAVSLTRRSDEMHLLDVNNIAGFFYLPSLTEDDARRLLARRSTERRVFAALIARPSAPAVRAALPDAKSLAQSTLRARVPLRANRDALSFARSFTCSVTRVSDTRATSARVAGDGAGTASIEHA